MPDTCSVSCTGTGIATQIYPLHCPGNVPPPALVRKAKQNAKDKASETCSNPRRCACRCVPQVIGSWCHNLPNNQHIWIVTASCDGRCVPRIRIRVVKEQAS